MEDWPQRSSEMGKLGIKAPTMVFCTCFIFFAASDLEQKMMDNCNQFCVKIKFFGNYTNLSLISLTQVLMVWLY